MKRRYGSKLAEDREVFDQCTDTIIRQVGDIGRMVDEFSSFARMPKPEMVPGDMAKVISDAVFLMSNGYPSISFKVHLPETGLPMALDKGLMGQVFANLMKNAAEGIASAKGIDDGPQGLAGDPKEDAGASALGLVQVDAWIDGDKMVVEVGDTGIGFPAAGRAKLLEPYMTTRAKGTGLGLAIVRRIVEDHGGIIRLMDGAEARLPVSGALVRMEFGGAEADEAALRGEPE